MNSCLRLLMAVTFAACVSACTAPGGSLVLEREGSFFVNGKAVQSQIRALRS